MRLFKISAIAVLLGLAFYSCENEQVNDKPKSSEKKQKSTELKIEKRAGFSANSTDQTYFFPAKPNPYVYVYSMNNNPLSENFLKVSSFNKKEDLIMVLEFFNSNLVLKEGYTINFSKGLLVENHMTDSQQTKFQSEIKRNQIFPINFQDTSRFASHFPDENDSLVQLLEIDRVIAEKTKYNYQNGQRDAIILDEYMKLTRINTVTKQNNARQFDFKKVFVRGVGQVATYVEGMKDTMKLTKVLTFDEWKGIGGK